MARRPTFADLVATMARLRAPDGCPWDRAQTPASLRPYLIEEAYETLDAIDGGAPDRLKEELGDLLLQVVFHSQMAAETGAFTIDDVVAGLVDKLVRRHPHVFGTATAATPDAVVARWGAIKQAERSAAEDTGALAGLARALPALMLAQQMLVRTGRAGFTTPPRGGQDAWLREAGAALEHATRRRGESPPAGDAVPAHVDDAAGDLLFAAAAVVHSLGIEPELALRAACDRYRARFARMEALARARGTALEALSSDQLASLWRDAGEAG